MSTKPPHRRRRPGRRTPNRRGTRHGPPPAGFTGPGFRQLHRAMLPGLDGPARRRHFNALSGVIVLAAGLGGLVFGLICFGPIGAILGPGAGIAVAGSFVESQRFYRE
jgi:hypothetical protein